jgi:hypothetical protein
MNIAFWFVKGGICIIQLLGLLRCIACVLIILSVALSIILVMDNRIFPVFEPVSYQSVCPTTRHPSTVKSRLPSLYFIRLRYEFLTSDHLLVFSPFPELFPGGLTLAGQLLQGAPASCPIYRAWLLANEKLDRYEAAYV